MKESSQIYRKIPVSFLATYPPRCCGIGTYTRDLALAAAKLQGEILSENTLFQVVALNDRTEGYSYGDEVIFEIDVQNRRDYQKAAEYLNLSFSQVVCIQHEFGIFGGPDGEHLISLLERLKKPIVTNLHTVMDKPSPHQKEVLKEICSYSTMVVVLADKAVDMLTRIYGVKKDKIRKVHHGAPDVPFLDTSYYKDQIDAEGKLVLLTFGLISPNKGIEYAIEALSEVVKKYPQILYIILGATHPNIKKNQGEEYRISLEHLVKKKGLEKNVEFHNRYVSLDELIKYLVTADIYITPYLSKEQIASGTLSYAVACGKAIISTPYWHAQELLSNNRGIIVPFRDSKALREAVSELVEDEVSRQKMRKKAYDFGRSMIWRQVASSFIQIFETAVDQYKERDRGMIISKQEREEIKKLQIGLPEVDLRYLQSLTDDTGILEHATYTIPNRNHGYTTDDNTRALIVSLKNWELFKDDSVLSFIQVYTSFLLHSFDKENKKVRNRLSYDRHWVEESESEDCCGRMIWAAGQLALEAPNGSLANLGIEMFRQAFNLAHDFTSPRAWAFAILGAVSYSKQFGGDRNAKLTCKKLGERLLELFKNNMEDDWVWGEDIVTYENARLPQALITFGQFYDNEQAVSVGLRSLKWLLKVQTAPEESHLTIIGNDGWYRRHGKRARFDQQPIEAAALIDALYEAYLATENSYFIDKIDWVYNWFLGSNDLGDTLYDFKTGGCRDGLQSVGLNKNEGAESLLAWLMALHKMYEIPRKIAYKSKEKVEDIF
jgi:glycosyltransferase involved in cell wall biosynthesis